SRTTRATTRATAMATAASTGRCRRVTISLPAPTAQMTARTDPYGLAARWAAVVASRGRHPPIRHARGRVEVVWAELDIADEAAPPLLLTLPTPLTPPSLLVHKHS